MSVGNIVKLQENTATLCKIRVVWNVGCGCSPDERYQKIRICLSGEVETPPLPSGIRGSRCEISDQRIRTCLTGHNFGWDIRTSQGGPSACVRCRDPSGSTPSGFPKRTCAAMLSGSTPSGFPKRTCAAMLSVSTPSGFPKRTCAAMLSGLP